MCLCVCARCSFWWWFGLKFYTKKPPKKLPPIRGEPGCGVSLSSSSSVQWISLSGCDERQTLAARWLCLPLSLGGGGGGVLDWKKAFIWDSSNKRGREKAGCLQPCLPESSLLWQGEQSCVMKNNGGETTHLCTFGEMMNKRKPQSYCY